MTDNPPESSDNSADDSSHRRQTTAGRFVAELTRHLRLRLFERRYGARITGALFTFVAGTVSIAVLSVVALLADSPFIFPSLGPTAYLLFHRPLAAASSPRNTIVGHLIGAICGWLSLVAFGLVGAPDALTAGVDWAYVGAAALSLGMTGGLMALFRVGHPPAGATTLIVSLGLMPFLWQLPVLMLAVGLMTLLGLGINRLVGVDYPLWSPGESRETTN